MTLKRRHWWFSCKRFTCYVATEGGVVVDGAPIVRRFIGQRAKNLGQWVGEWKARELG